MAQNLVQLNKFLRKNGVPSNVELVKNHKEGYFYFTGTGTDNWAETMVCVFKMNHLTEAQWLEEYKRLAGDDLMVEKTNLMSGKKYMEAKGTPLCCSPSSETYWSM